MNTRHQPPSSSHAQSGIVGPGNSPFGSQDYISYSNPIKSTNVGQNFPQQNQFLAGASQPKGMKNTLEKTFLRIGEWIWGFCSTGVSGIVTALVVFIVLTALFIWPGFSRPQTLDSAKTEHQIKDLVERTFGWSNITDIQCNTSNVQVKRGNTFTCVIFTGDIHAKIQAQFTDDNGNYSISKPIFNAS